MRVTALELGEICCIDDLGQGEFFVSVDNLVYRGIDNVAVYMVSKDYVTDEFSVTCVSVPGHYHLLGDVYSYDAFNSMALQKVTTIRFSDK